MTIEHAFRMSDIGQQVSLRLKVTGVRRFRFRLWAALQVLKLAGWVAPIGMTLELQDEREDITEPDGSTFPPRAWAIDKPGIYPAGHPDLLKFDVLLDGEKVDMVRGYDCDKGWVKVFRRDERGLALLTPDMTSVQEEVRCGHVTLELRA